MHMVPEKLKGFSHPLINEMYLKKHSNNDEDILVIEATFNSDEQDDIYDDYMISLLSDLNEIEKQARHRIGPFDRIDIRTHVTHH